MDRVLNIIAVMLLFVAALALLTFFPVIGNKIVEHIAGHASEAFSMYVGFGLGLITACCISWGFYVINDRD